MISAALALVALALPVDTPAGGVRLELARGRAEISAEGAAARALEGPAKPESLPARAELSLSAAARARLSWNGSASLELEGPCRISWSPAGEGPEAAARPFVRVQSLSRAEVEVRAGAELVLRLPEGFDLQASGSAFALERRAAGANVRVHAGADLRVRSLTSRPAGSWPARIAAGSSSDLAPAER